MQSRAVRRHHEERIKHRVQKYYAGVHRGDPRRIGLIAHSRQLCSCFMCGNPRKWLDEPTRQESIMFVMPALPAATEKGGGSATECHGL